MRNAVRSRGHSMRGNPLQKRTLLVRGERISAIVIMSVEGILDVTVHKGTTSGDTFTILSPRSYFLIYCLATVLTIIMLW